jgi:multiple sugar transport system permease protein
MGAFMDIRKIVKDDKFIAWLLLLPASFVLIVIRLTPMVQGIGYSFTNKRMLGALPLKFKGLANFSRLFQDALYWRPVGFTLIFSLSTVLIAYACGLTIAMIMNLQIKAGRGVFRSILMIPWVIPTVVAAYVWRYAYNDQIGIFNILLQNLGLTTAPITFLSTPTTARISVIITSAWKSAPFMSLVLLAGLQNVGEDIKEAARIDGANAWQTFLHVIWPQLNIVTAMGTTLIFVQSFNSFDIVYMLTNGGPGEATLILSVLAYQTAFDKFSTSYGSTMASLMLVFMLFFTVCYMRIMRRDNEN